MCSEVEATVRILSRECQFIEAIKRALEPDNAKVPPNMKIEEIVERASTGECMYKVRIKVRGELKGSLRRARSTTDEILAIVKTLNKTLEFVVKEKH